MHVSIDEESFKKVDWWSLELFTEDKIISLLERSMETQKIDWLGSFLSNFYKIPYKKVKKND